MTDSESPTRFPLWWPPGQVRTPARDREASRFKCTDVSGYNSLVEELHRIPGANLDRLVLSTNVALRLDGLPRANQPRPEDPGVAVFFEFEGSPMALACDRYPTVRENMRGLAKHVEATRGIERWGCGTLRQAFAGYRMLAYTSGRTPRPWRKVLGACESGDDVRRAYRQLSVKRHPDQGGSAEDFQELSQARDDALKELGDA